VHGFFQHDRPARFGCGRAHALQIQRGVHALRSQLCADLGADAPCARFNAVSETPRYRILSAIAPRGWPSLWVRRWSG
jgi:hypothetical protein